jgi:hypothetical protein
LAEFAAGLVHALRMFSRNPLAMSAAGANPASRSTSQTAHAILMEIISSPQYCANVGNGH